MGMIRLGRKLNLEERHGVIVRLRKMDESRDESEVRFLCYNKTEKDRVDTEGKVKDFKSYNFCFSIK